ncbi:transmembrane protein 41 homolog [Halichondria panicea]|uniref:transmembrane protein 41 homolog n=1 Tax=Halichondria panicea TaxID=6063 RepID=UPI00312B5BEE
MVVSRSNMSSPDKERSPFKTLLVVAVVFLSSAFSLAVLFRSFPPLDEYDWERVRLPLTLDDAKDLGELFSRLKETHYTTVLCTVAVTYIFLQTFAIPGSISLTILSGYLFPFPVALLLVCTCSATGATFCYLLSSLLGEGLLLKYCTNRITTWRTQVSDHQHDMLWYILFLRITPFLPNWFINLAAPLVGVRLAPFYWGTFLGVAPPSFLFIRAGTALYELTTTTGHMSWSSLGLLCLMAIISLAPVLARRCLKKKLF